MSEHEIFMLSLPKEIVEKVEALASRMGRPKSVLIEYMFNWSLTSFSHFIEMYKKESVNTELKVPKKQFDDAVDAIKSQGFSVTKEFGEKVYGFLLGFHLWEFFQFGDLMQKECLRKFLEDITIEGEQ